LEGNPRINLSEEISVPATTLIDASTLHREPSRKTPTSISQALGIMEINEYDIKSEMFNSVKGFRNFYQFPDLSTNNFRNKKVDSLMLKR